MPCLFPQQLNVLYRPLDCCFAFPFYKLQKLPRSVLLRFTILNELYHKQYREYICRDIGADTLRLKVGFDMVHLYIPTDSDEKA